MGNGAGSAKWLGYLEAYQNALRLGRLESYRQRRWQQSDELFSWLEQSTLPDLSMEQALVLYRASGGGRTGEFRTNPIEEVRDSLDFLLFDTIMLEGRFDECAAPEGAYNLAGTGKEFYSYLLCLRSPALFAVWNSHAERALRRLEIFPKTLRKGHLGLRYLDLLESLQPVRQQLGLADFRVVDEFAYALSQPADRTSG